MTIFYVLGAFALGMILGYRQAKKPSGAPTRPTCYGHFRYGQFEAERGCSECVVSFICVEHTTAGTNFLN